MSALPDYRAVPEGVPRAAVLVLMEAFGLTPHIREICDRLAAAGYLAIAPDLYRRFGAGLVFDMDSLDAALECYQRLRPEQALADIDAALHTLPGGLPVAVAGFCMGGMLAFIAACERSDRLAAASCFYGGGIEHQLERGARLRVPVQLHYAASDPFIPPSAVAATCERLLATGADLELRNYPGTGHGFMCVQREGHEPAAASRAWQALLDFLLRTTARTSPPA